MSSQSLSLRRIAILLLPLAAAIVVFGVNGSWRASASVPGFTLVTILGVLYLMVFAATFSSAGRSVRGALAGVLSGVRAEAAASMGISVDDKVPAAGSPVKAVVVGSKGTCPIGISTGYRVKIDEDGNLSEPLCRGAIDAISGTARANLEGREVSTACICPRGPQQLWFAFKQSV